MATLTDTKVKNSKPKSKPFKLYDSEGLYLMVQPTGTKSWYFRYKFGDKLNQIHLGKYPAVSLAAARDKRLENQTHLSNLVDPAEVRDEKLTKLKQASEHSFKVFGQSWFDRVHKSVADSTRVRNQRILDYLIAELGKLEIPKIKRKAIKDACLRIQKERGVETAHRALALCVRIFADAATDDLIEIDPTFGVKGKLGEIVERRRVALTKPKQVGKLLQAIWAYHGWPQTTAALKLLAMTMLRPGELRQLRWEEVDFKKKLLVIPPERMKMRRNNPEEFLVPLSTQAIQVLKNLKKLELDADLVFPTNRPNRPLSENSFSVALQTMGYSGDKHQPHGFRSTASTMLHEMNFNHEVIETALAHSRPGISGIYNRSHLLPQRREMLQAWADHMDTLRAGKGGNVVPIKGKASA
jgi:integrase